MDRTVHDMRNNLAVAIANVEALIDGKLLPTPEVYRNVHDALEELDARITELRIAALAATDPGKENLLNAVVEGSPYAKVLVNALGRITLVNAQTEALFGYARAELLGEPIEVLVPERFRLGHPALRNAFLAAPVARPMGAGRDLFGRRKDGSEVAIEIGLNPIVTDAGTYTLAAITDITERKRAEAERLLHVGVQQHAAELEELNRELADASRFKTEFVSTMSHELRTPLTAIIGASELLARSDLDERDALCVQTINEAAEALFSLINSILDFSKIEAGKLDLHVAPFEIETVVESAADVVAQLARDNQITLHSYVDPLIPPVKGDSDRVRQVLLNLLGNAVKFTERGRVVVRALPLELNPTDVLVRFEVQDTGIGIDPSVIPHLFEPFAQADRSASRKHPGTGLGLSISKRLIQLMGGDVGVHSDVGAGSLFWFTARFERATESTAPKRTIEGVGGLVLSGDETFVEIVERYMASWQMESRLAATRDDVMQALQAQDTTWIAIVDLDDVGIADLGVTVDILRAIVPARVIGIGKDGPLRKPVRQSYLFDAIVKAVDVTRERPPVATRTAEEPAPAAHGPILVAEDNLQLQRLLKLQFDSLGVPVTFVSDGLQAVEARRSTPYAMMFMDCQMPNMDGFTATKSIRDDERQNGGYLPIVAMTANAFAEDREACLAAGMDDYLAKPVKLADLSAMIGRWAKRNIPSG